MADEQNMHDEFMAEEPAVLDRPNGIESPADPEGYVGPDGKAAPHEDPVEVRTHYDEELDETYEENGGTPTV